MDYGNYNEALQENINGYYVDHFLTNEQLGELTRGAGKIVGKLFKKKRKGGTYIDDGTIVYTKNYPILNQFFNRLDWRKDHKQQYAKQAIDILKTNSTIPEGFYEMYTPSTEGVTLADAILAERSGIKKPVDIPIPEKVFKANEIANQQKINNQLKEIGTLGVTEKIKDIKNVVTNNSNNNDTPDKKNNFLNLDFSDPFLIVIIISIVVLLIKR